MKTDIHPKYKTVTFSCACGATFTAGSTYKDDEFKTEICSQCHPFYTGKQKLVDSSGRVEKFMAKMKKAQKDQEGSVKKIETDENAETPEETSEETSEETPQETSEEITEESKAKLAKKEPKEKKEEE